MRNKENNFPIRTLIWRPERVIFCLYFRYRKIPGDHCSKGFNPKSKKIDLKKACSEKDKTYVKIDETPVVCILATKRHTSYDFLIFHFLAL